MPIAWKAPGLKAWVYYAARRDTSAQICRKHSRYWTIENCLPCAGRPGDWVARRTEVRRELSWSARCDKKSAVRVLSMLPGCVELRPDFARGVFACLPGVRSDSLDAPSGFRGSRGGDQRVAHMTAGVKFVIGFRLCIFMTHSVFFRQDRPPMNRAYSAFRRAISLIRERIDYWPFFCFFGDEGGFKVAGRPLIICCNSPTWVCRSTTKDPTLRCSQVMPQNTPIRSAKTVRAAIDSQFTRCACATSSAFLV
jgi:hypothetical protein